MAGYEHPSEKDLAAHDMRVALVACRAALQAELTQRGDNDATYEFPAQPAVDAASAAIARAEVAFGFPPSNADPTMRQLPWHVLDGLGLRSPR